MTEIDLINHACPVCSRLHRHTLWPVPGGDHARYACGRVCQVQFPYRQWQPANDPLFVEAQRRLMEYISSAVEARLRLDNARLPCYPGATTEREDPDDLPELPR